MPLPNPTFIPIKKKEMMSVSSWRSATPEPAKEENDMHFLKLALSAAVTREAATKVVERVVYGGSENLVSFVVGPGQIPLPTRKKSDKEGGATVSPVVTPGVTPKTGAALDGDDMPAMALPGAAAPASSGKESPIPETSPMLCFGIKRLSEAEDSKKALLAAFPSLTGSGGVHLCTSENEQRLPTLVIKALPFNLSPDTFLTQLQVLTHMPRHIRLQRGDRGMFRCVLFIKYATAVQADVAKIELERFVYQGKPLKVEYKKRARRYLPPGGDTVASSAAQLTDLVNELKVSKENEGFTFPKGVLSKEEQKLLKGLAASHDMSFDAPDAVTVKRRHIPAPDKSPVVRPAGTTPPWQPATPGTNPQLNTTSPGLNFRGIRAWKETRSENFKLGKGLPIMRPQGPNDVTPFAAGRGRPMKK